MAEGQGLANDDVAVTVVRIVVKVGATEPCGLDGNLDFIGRGGREIAVFL